MLLAILRIAYLLVCAGAIVAYINPEDVDADAAALPRIINDHKLIAFFVLLLLTQVVTFVDLVIRKKGYQTVKASWDVKPPWYQYIPIDFFAEVLWPGQIHDVHSKRVTLALKQLPSAEDLVERASETRTRALDRHK